MKAFLVQVLLVLLIKESSCQQQTFEFYNNRMHITVNNFGDRTIFSLTTTLGNGVNVANAWVAVGLNDKPKMVTSLQNLNIDISS